SGRSRDTVRERVTRYHGPMKLGARWVVGALLALVVLAAPWAQPAEAHRPAPPSCPRARVQDGTACRRETMSCSWRGTHEGSRDVACTCVRGADDRLTWHCESRGEVYGD